MEPEDKQQVKVISTDSPVIQSISTSVVLVGAIVGGIALIAVIGYMTVKNSYDAKVQDRKENALLYNDPNEKNLFADDLNELPPVNVGANAQQQQQQSQLQVANQQQVLGQQAAQQRAAQQQQAPPKAEKTNTPTPSPTPKDTFINEKKKFSVTNKGWNKENSTSAGSNTVITYKSPDSVYTFTISEMANFNSETKKKYDSLDEYLNTNPGGRKPGNGTEAIKLSGKDGLKAKPFIMNNNGSSVKTIGAYVFSEDSEYIYSLELDSTSLDINNSDADTVFKDITSSFTFIK